jgi:hypothetical protein
MKTFVATVLLCASAAAQAQPAAALPPKLSGMWNFPGPPQSIVDTFSIVFDGDGAPGQVRGRLTWRGFNCGAQDEPFAGTWDGSELKFEATVRPNVNASRVNGTCPPGPTRFLLRRKPGETRFTGEAVGSSATVTMTASP